MKLKGSDLHLKVDSPPYVRVNGTLKPLNRDPIDDEEMVRLIFPMIGLQERRKQIFEEDGGVDFAYMLEVDGERWRYRVNVLQQMGHVGLVARRVNRVIPDFEKLHLPPSLAELCKFAQGMILLAGITGSGKSTTIASMLDLAVFFAVLLVGFAYVWRRGDLDWVRAVRHPTMAAESAATALKLQGERQP